MRIAIPHTLSKDEVRARIAARMDSAQDKAGALVGGPLTLTLDWTGDYTLAVKASAMGFAVPTTLTITDATLDFDVTIPAGLGFARGMIDGMIREKGEKLLA